MTKPKPIQQIVEEGLSEAFLEVWQKNILKELGWVGLRIEMPRRGRYQVGNGMELVADRIKHRKEALAVMKLIGENNG